MSGESVSTSWPFHPSWWCRLNRTTNSSQLRTLNTSAARRCSGRSANPTRPRMACSSSTFSSADKFIRKYIVVVSPLSRSPPPPPPTVVPLLDDEDDGVWTAAPGPDPDIPHPHL